MKMTCLLLTFVFNAQRKRKYGAYTFRMGLEPQADEWLREEKELFRFVWSVWFWYVGLIINRL